MKALSYITLLLIFFNVLFVARFFQQNNRPITVTQKVIQPAIHLVNTKLYFEESNYNRSIEELQEGIEEIEELKGYLRPVSQQKVSEALDELRAIYQEARSTRLPKDDINEASINMLLSLTYSQVKAAKYFAVDEEPENCRVALKYAMYHVKNALILSEGTKKDYEIQIFAEMNQIIKDRTLTSTQVVSSIDQILIELESSQVVFS